MYKPTPKKFAEELNAALRQIDAEYNRKSNELQIPKSILDTCKALLPKFVIAPEIWPIHNGSLELSWSYHRAGLSIIMFEDKYYVAHCDRLGECTEYETSVDALTDIVRAFFSQ